MEGRGEGSECELLGMERGWSELGCPRDRREGWGVYEGIWQGRGCWEWGVPGNGAGVTGRCPRGLGVIPAGGDSRHWRGWGRMGWLLVSEGTGGFQKAQGKLKWRGIPVGAGGPKGEAHRRGWW